MKPISGRSEEKKKTRSQRSKSALPEKVNRGNRETVRSIKTKCSCRNERPYCFTRSE